MRGGNGFPDPLLDIEREDVVVGRETVTVIRPSDWAELRHQEGAEGRSAPYWAIAWPSGLGLADALAGRDLSGLRVLGLGRGPAVPSMVAARAGQSVVAKGESPDAVVFAAHNL